MNSVKIGDQEWMAQNLDVSLFRNGDPIPEARTPEEWRNAAKEEQPAWCHVDNNPENDIVFGKLYNWNALNDPRGLAPHGWRIPADEDWEVMITDLGGDADAGGKMKGKELWKVPNAGATSESGLAVLPGGYRCYRGGFHAVGFMGCFWSLTEINPRYASSRYLYSHNTTVRHSRSGHKGEGLSVRCIRG
ncbi:MAG: fibrobacter succinogenes major paralogous domain-containing protein [Candidatus Aminicenantes bacterium]|nr:fibrobacter succinogenes major paralogous domain-containing protein [Candidatus Aminicenantes bacterium]